MEYSLSTTVTSGNTMELIELLDLVSEQVLNKIFINAMSHVFDSSRELGKSIPTTTFKILLADPRIELDVITFMNLSVDGIISDDDWIFALGKYKGIEYSDIATLVGMAGNERRIDALLKESPLFTDKRIDVVDVLKNLGEGIIYGTPDYKQILVDNLEDVDISKVDLRVRLYTRVWYSIPEMYQSVFLAKTMSSIPLFRDKILALI